MTDKTGNRLYGAIEAGGTKFICALGADPRQIYKSTTFATESPDKTLKQAIAFFDAAQAEYGPIDGFGVASFGPVQVDRQADNYGSILNTPKPGWSGFNFLSSLGQYAVPVCVESDVGGAGVGEMMHGAGMGLDSLAYVTVGTGVGASLIRDGRPANGLGHPELGHIRVPIPESDPYPGFCVFHQQCLEGMACGPAILARWGANLSELPESHPALDLEAHYLSHLALTIILSYLPERLILGGGVMKATGLLERIRDKTQELLGGYMQHDQVSGPLGDYIVAPALGDRAGIVGAMHLAIQADQNL